MNQKDIIDKYTYIFNKKINETKQFDLKDNGWNNLIIKTIDSIIELLSGTKTVITITKVTKKYGQLRIYFNLKEQTKYIYDSGLNITKHASKQSQFICEKCGKPGKKQMNKVLCFWHNILSYL